MADPDLRSQLSAGYWDRIRQQQPGNIGDPPKRELGNIGADPPQRSTGARNLDPLTDRGVGARNLDPLTDRGVGARNLDPLPPGRPLEGIYKPEVAPRFAQGGMVKHGSSTRVSCKTKHGG